MVIYYSTKRKKASALARRTLGLPAPMSQTGFAIAIPRSSIFALPIPCKYNGSYAEETTKTVVFLAT